MKKLILASQSPRRRELLAQVGIEFEVQISQASEETDLTAPAEIVEELSKRKAQSVFILHPSDIVLGADTIVALGDKIYGKPETYGEAFDMISELAGHVHQVYTGCAFAYAEESGLAKISTHVEKTDVYVGEMSDDEIRAYLAKKDIVNPAGMSTPHEIPVWKDKAGGYGIQGSFAEYISKIDGDYYNVVGLPLYYVAHELKRIRMN